MRKREKDTSYVTKPIEKISFASFFFGQGLIFAFVGGQYLMYFLNKHAQIDALIVSAILLVGKIWDAVNDTLFGYIVDKVRFKNGNKYKPWLWIATFLVPVFTIIMFCINPTMPLWLRITIFAVGYFLWDTAYTVCDAPAFALVTAMTPNVKERIGLTTFANIGGVLATGLFSIAIVPFFNKYGGFSASLLIAPISMITMLFLCIFAKERVKGRAVKHTAERLGPMSENPAKEQEKELAVVGVEKACESFVTGVSEPESLSDAVSDVAVSQTQEEGESALPPSPSFKETLRYLIKNKYMLIFYLYRILSGALFIQYTAYIADYYFGDPNLVSMIMVIAIPFILVVYALSGLISKRFDKITVYRAAMIASMGLNTLIFFLGRNSKWVYIVGMALFAALNILPSIYMTAIPGDCAEYGTYKTGTHNEGITFSLQTFTAKITSAISIALSGLLLHLIGYDETIQLQTQSTLNWMWTIGTLLPVLAQIIGLPILFLYKLKDKDAQLMSDYNHEKLSKEEVESKLSRKY